MNILDCISIQARDFSQSKRKKLAKTGAAEPDGSFPIADKQDLKNAERAVGRSKNPAKTKEHIKKRAKALGMEALSKDKKRYKKGVETLSKEITRRKKMKAGGDLGDSSVNDPL